MQHRDIVDCSLFAIGCFAWLDLCLPIIPTAIHGRGSEPLILVMVAVVGCVAGQIATLSTLATLFTRNRISRFLWTILAVLGIGYLLGIGIRLVSMATRMDHLIPFDASVASGIGALIFATYATSCGLLLITQQITGWQIVPRNVDGSLLKQQSSQFQIQHMFAWTAGIAAALGVGRFVLPSEGWPNVFRFFDPWILLFISIASIVAAIPLLALIPTILGKQRDSYDVIPRIAVTIGALTSFETVAFLFIFVVMSGGLLTAELFFWFAGSLLCANLGDVITVAVCLELLRAFGYRLESKFARRAEMFESKGVD